MTSPNLISWLALYYVPQVGVRTYVRLVEAFGSAEAVFGADIFALTQAVVKPEIITALASKKPFEDAQKLLEILQKEKIGVVTFRDPQYPARLLQASDFPPLLFYRGHIEILNQGEWLAVVGSRQMTRYGQSLCETFIPPLVASGIRIASGFALGVDMEAHRQTVAAGGVTAAVFGSGLARLSPKSNQKYADEILKDGVLLSEFLPYDDPRPEYFPRRNRIISGLSRGVLVIEAGLKSGSLITSRYALEQNRDVFAIPGPITSPQSEGCHSLIQQGAKLVSRADDILTDWMMAPAMTSVPAPKAEPLLEPDERSVFDSFGANPCLMDEVMEKTGLPPARVMSLLTGLELKGLLKSLPGQYYARVGTGGVH